MTPVIRIEINTHFYCYSLRLKLHVTFNHVNSFSRDCTRALTQHVKLMSINAFIHLDSPFLLLKPLFNATYP